MAKTEPVAATAADQRGLEGEIDHAIRLAAARTEPGATLDEVLEVSSAAAPSAADVEEIRDLYQRHREVIDAALEASRQILDSTEGAAALADLETYLTVNGSGIDGEAVVAALAQRPEVTRVAEAAATTGLQAIGLGVAASFSLLLVGAEKGIERVILLDRFQTPPERQFTSRDWRFASVGVDLLASAGLNWTFWFTPPETGGIGGTIVDVILVGGVRVATIVTKEKGNLRAPGTQVGFSVRLSLGLEVGGAKYLGTGSVPAGDTILPPGPEQLAGLAVINTATGQSVIDIGETAELLVDFTPPIPFVELNAGSTVTLTMPPFLTDTVGQMVVDPPPASWEVAPPGNGSLELVYVGQPAQWTTPLVFPVENVKSNSTEPASGAVVAKLTETSAPYPVSARSELQLAQLTYTSGITFDVVAPNFEITGPPAGADTAVTPPSDFVPLSQATDPSSGTTWVLGYQFAMADSGGGVMIPTMNAIWWKENSPNTARNQYLSGPVSLSPSGQTEIRAYYGAVGGPNYLLITADAPEQSTETTIQLD